MILYLCDGLRECAGRNGCCAYGIVRGPCRRTTDPSHARNGACPDPQNHTERFEKMKGQKGEWNGMFVEKEELP